MHNPIRPLGLRQHARRTLDLLTLTACAGALALLTGAPPAHAHGSAAAMQPMAKTLESFGASMRWDAYAGVYTLSHNSTLVRVKPGARTALVNGQPQKLSVPVTMRHGQPFVSTKFINEVFQSGLDKTFVVERTPSPLNPLSAQEISSVVEILKAEGRYQAGHRFTEITLKAIPFKVLPFSPVVLRDRQEKRDVVRGTGSV